MREYKFDIHNEMNVAIPEEKEKVCLALSDSLEVINEELTSSYKAKLDHLLDQSSVWYPKALEKFRRNLQIYHMQESFPFLSCLNKVTLT